VVSLPIENLIEPSVSFIFLSIADITCEALPSPLLQALFAEAIMPLVDNSITNKSLGILGTVIFILFGNLFFKSPFIIMSVEIFCNFLIK
jgi:hypothetical protein